jgi:hypothetical protein
VRNARSPAQWLASVVAMATAANRWAHVLATACKAVVPGVLGVRQGARTGAMHAALAATNRAIAVVPDVETAHSPA